MAQQTDLSPGQVWTYKNPALPTSRVIIGKIDQGSAGGTRIISVSITDVPIPTNSAPFQTVGHSPFAEEVLRSSLLGHERDEVIPASFFEGYQLWRNAFDAGKGGYFTIPVDEAVEFLAEAVAKGKTN